MVNHCSKIGWFCMTLGAWPVAQGVGIQIVKSRYARPTASTTYPNDYCLSPFDCIGLRDVVAANEGGVPVPSHG